MKILIFLVGSANGGQPQQQQQQQQAQAAGGGAGAAGTADYSKQWAEYYRSIGKIDEAEAIENQLKATKVRTWWIVVPILLKIKTNLLRRLEVRCPVPLVVVFKEAEM